jgi:hypothetical protein
VYSVHTFRRTPKLRKLRPLTFFTLERAKEEVAKMLGVKSLGRGVMEWRGDSLNGFAMGFCRKDDPKETLFVEIHCDQWEEAAENANEGLPYKFLLVDSD